MTIRQVLLLGNPKLYETSGSLLPDEMQDVQRIISDLHDTLIDFRQKYGIGRAIAAPQIGVMKRILYMLIDDCSTVFINPEISKKSKELTEIWDDCMCFPDLLVKVKRHKTCRIRFRNLKWEMKELKADGDLSELLQHEHDHLNGILAVSRAIDGQSFAVRNERDSLNARINCIKKKY